MGLKELIGLRPKATTAAALRTSLAEAEAAHKIASDRILELQRDRGARLLDAEPDALAKAESDLAAARSEVDRLDALLPVIRDRLAEGVSLETAAEIRAAILAATARRDAFLRWLLEAYPGFAAQIAAGLAEEAAIIGQLEACKAMLTSHRAELTAADLAALAKMDFASPFGIAFPGVFNGYSATFGENIRLHSAASVPPGGTIGSMWPPPPAADPRAEARRREDAAFMHRKSVEWLRKYAPAQAREIGL